MNDEKVRLNVYLPQNVAKDIRELSELLGMSQTRMGGIAVIYGVQALKMATNPDMKEFFEKELARDEKILK